MVKEFLQLLQNSKDPLLILDIEIKWESKKQNKVDWRRSAEEIVLAQIQTSQMGQFQEQLNSLRAVYSPRDPHADYDLSLHLFAFATIRTIPVIVISTKASSVDGDRHEVKATVAGIPSINNWTVDWQKAWLEPNRTAIINGIAKAVNSEWEKWRGTMEQRLWPEEAVQGAGWFSGGKNSHNLIPHGSNNEKCKCAAYTLRIKQYVEAVTGLPLGSRWKPLSNCHDALKHLVGAAAKAHAKPGTGHVPQLNAVALLVAAWDPNASQWFPTFKWDAVCALMKEAATQVQLRQVLLALGGEDGLFAKLIAMESDPAVSNLKQVTTTADCLKLEFAFDLTKDKYGGAKGIKQLFEAARKSACGIKPDNETSGRLIEAWKKLAVDGKRMIDIEVADHEIIFKKEKKP